MIKATIKPNFIDDSGGHMIEIKGTDTHSYFRVDSHVRIFERKVSAMLIRDRINDFTLQNYNMPLSVFSSFMVTNLTEEYIKNNVPESEIQPITYRKRRIIKK